MRLDGRRTLTPLCRLVVVLGLAPGLNATLAASAQEPAPPKEAGPSEAAKAAAVKPPEAPEPAETSSTTRHRVVIDGKPVSYAATASLSLLRKEDGTPRATVFSIAYLREGVADAKSRPVTFSFNGGPGSAAVWVNLGAFGPRRAVLDPEGLPPGPLPGRLVDNELSLLDATDLVFIDPVGTGFSRPAPGQDAKQFYGFKNDVESVAEFIRLWLSRNGRWASPKLIAGESYGTTRTVGLARHLQEKHGAFFNGIVLISSVLQWQTLFFGTGNDLPPLLFLPTYTATAWYHKKLPPELSGGLKGVVAEAERFALEEYGPALLLGQRLPGAKREEMARKVARLTGLSPEFVLRNDLRIGDERFRKELLRAEGKLVGRLDSRYAGVEVDPGAATGSGDPAGSVVDAYFVSLMNDHVRSELGFKTDLPYRHSAELWKDWNYAEGENAALTPNYGEHLRAALLANPGLKVLVTSGYYDLATPHFATDFTLDHLDLPKDLRQNVEVAYYQAGHMMYVRRADHQKLRADLLAFIQKATVSP